MDHLSLLGIDSKVVPLAILQQKVAGKTIIDHDLLSLIFTGSLRIVYLDAVDQSI